MNYIIDVYGNKLRREQARIGIFHLHTYSYQVTPKGSSVCVFPLVLMDLHEATKCIFYKSVGTGLESSVKLWNTLGLKLIPGST